MRLLFQKLDNALLVLHQKLKLNIMKKETYKIHYAISGEWGGEKVNCGRYYTSDVAHTGNFKKVTCKRCKGTSKTP